MLLAVDIGNTNLTCGLFAGEVLAHTFRLGTRRGLTSDEYAAVLHQVATLRLPAGTRVTGAVVASVVPPLTACLVDAVSLAFGVRAACVGRDLEVPLPVACDNPKEVGADRLVNAVAACHLFRNEPPGHGVVVVDFGTATTLDCISPASEYLGGIIAPGPSAALEALIGRTAQLPAVEMAAPPHALGTNTRHAIQSGVVLGHASMVDGLVERLRQELAFPCRTLATGGLASLIRQHCRTIQRVEPDLTLLGLRLLSEGAGADPR